MLSSPMQGINLTYPKSGQDGNDFKPVVLELWVSNKYLTDNPERILKK